jgi:hypothetical protein
MIKDKKSVKIIKEGIDKLREELKEGKSERLKEYLKIISSFRNYSFYNTILIFIQMKDARIVAGFRKWNELGYKIKKGSNAIRILAPRIYKYYIEKGIPIYIKNNNDVPRDKEIEEGIYYFGVNVFDISQTEKTENAKVIIEDYFYNIGNDFKDKYLDLVNVIRGKGIIVKEEELINGAQGYATKERKITIKKSNDYNNKLLTLIHEWAHIIIHIEGKREYFEFDIKDKEVQAESISYIIGNYYGLKNPFASDYILHWGRSREALKYNLKYIVEASKEMIKEIEKNKEKKIKLA